MKRSIDIRSLNQEAEELSRVIFLEELLIFSLDDLNFEIPGFSFNNGLCGNKDIFINKKFGSISFMKIIGHVKSLTARTGLIKEWSVTDLKSSEFLNDSLIVKKRLESALGNLCLIRSVGSVPKSVKKYQLGFSSMFLRITEGVMEG